ncbi:MAG: bL35 family ribosomal protein [Planctomycetota bacterium]
MGKNKPHKGLLKRVRISKTGKVRHRKAYHQHLRSHKTGKRLRHLRMDAILSDAESKRFGRLLFRRIRGRTMPRASLRSNPTPEQRAEIQKQKIAERKAALEAYLAERDGKN